MAGGTWTTQNKVRPGVYINIKSEATTLGTLGTRGVVALALSLPWGPSKTVLRLQAGEDTSKQLGYDITSSTLLLVREAFKRAQTVLLYRLNTGTKAAVTTGNLTATAKYGGVRGNNLSIVIAVNVDDSSKFDVSTVLSGVVVDKQTVANIAGLTANDWVVWSGTGTLAASAGAPLVNGADGSVTNQDHTDFLAALELQDFNTVAYTGTASDLKAVYTAYVRRLREDEGKKIQVVMENYTTANYEGVISVKNGVILADGTTLTAAQATAWVAGATAGAEVNESLTYSAYDGSTDVNPRYTNGQIVSALQAGEFVFTPSNGSAVVEQDINSLTGFTPDKGRAFSKNRVLRVLDGIGNDLVRIFSTFYLGKVPNNGNGRSLLKNECVNYMNNLQNIGAIQNFTALTDIVVTQGADSDTVLIDAAVQPVDSIEKIYMTVEVS